MVERSVVVVVVVVVVVSARPMYASSSCLVPGFSDASRHSTTPVVGFHCDVPGLAANA